LADTGDPLHACSVQAPGVDAAYSGVPRSWRPCRRSRGPDQQCNAHWSSRVHRAGPARTRRGVPLRRTWPAGWTRPSRVHVAIPVVPSRCSRSRHCSGPFCWAMLLGAGLIATAAACVAAAVNCAPGVVAAMPAVTRVSAALAIPAWQPTRDATGSRLLVLTLLGVGLLCSRREGLVSNPGSSAHSRHMVHAVCSVCALTATDERHISGVTLHRADSP